MVATAMAWAYLFLLAARMGTMGSPLAMPMTARWTAQDVVLMWTMWAVMMAAMMLPSAVPMISAYSTTIGSGNANLHGSTPLFVSGYLTAWSAFAAVGTAAQWVLHDAALVDAMGVSESDVLGGLILVGAGAYQFTSLKNACLTQCRTPLGFLLNEWRPGSGGAVVMGIRHGTLCIGCCWALMAMLFLLGVMNLWWIALVAAVVLLEKLVPSSALTRALGGVLALWGAMLIVGIVR
jgi:predicted metal-binding membrane protein